LIAIDTNILVYARRAETPHHAEARALLVKLAEGDTPWAIPWPCVYEFLRVVTHPRVFDPPTPIEAAIAGLESLFESPSLVLLGESHLHRAQLRRAIQEGGASGNLIHDAHIVALALEHGISEFLTADRDFDRFLSLRCRNPFVREP
jgi:toxin-antitoxin system PIN domain toxin